MINSYLGKRKRLLAIEAFLSIGSPDGKMLFIGKFMFFHLPCSSNTDKYMSHLQRYTERLSPSAKLSFRGKASSRNERTSHEHPGRSLSPTLGQWLLVRPPASWRPRA